MFQILFKKSSNFLIVCKAKIFDNKSKRGGNQTEKNVVQFFHNEEKLKYQGTTE